MKSQMFDEGRIFRTNISTEQADNRLTKYPLLPGWPLSNIRTTYVVSQHENNMRSQGMHN